MLLAIRLLAAAMNFFPYWFGDRMILKRYAASQVEPDTLLRSYGIAAESAQKAGFPMQKALVGSGRNPNAFAAGRNPEHAAGAPTEGISKILGDDELPGVMVHKFSHAKNHDMLTGIIAVTIADAVARFEQFARFGTGDQGRRGNFPGTMLILIGAPLGAMLIRMAVFRVREYAADEGGAEMSGKPLAIAHALEKLHRGVQTIPAARRTPSSFFYPLFHAPGNGIRNIKSLTVLLSRYNFSKSLSLSCAEKE